MKEVLFIKHNAQGWKYIEAVIAGKERISPDDLADQYIRLTDDLSYARTFYPDSRTTQYLNGLAGKIHQLIYKNKREHRGRIWAFFKYEMPMAAGAAHGKLLLSFIIFSIAILIGVVSAAENDAFLRVILGDGYVEQTISNIKSGDPMGVYKSAGAFDMFIQIMFNNVRVSFLAFVMGIFLSVGTAYLLFFNGIMLGAFHTFFHQYNLLYDSLLTVYLHGALEISAIVIAGGAGFCLGNSILFPGTYSRLESLKRGARQGIKIIMGIVPIFVVAAFIEGYITRHDDMPLWLNLLIVLGSFAFIIGYFVLYPIYLKKNQPA